MEEYTVQILGMREDTPMAQRPRAGASRLTDKNLNATVIATNVIARLTQGPQSVASTIIVIARRGKNDRPIASPGVTATEEMDVSKG
jgi:hypothetical protein